MTLTGPTSTKQYYWVPLLCWTVLICIFDILITSTSKNLFFPIDRYLNGTLKASIIYSQISEGYLIRFSFRYKSIRCSREWRNEIMGVVTFLWRFVEEEVSLRPLDSLEGLEFGVIERRLKLLFTLWNWWLDRVILFLLRLTDRRFGAPGMILVKV